MRVDEPSEVVARTPGHSLVMRCRNRVRAMTSAFRMRRLASVALLATLLGTGFVTPASAAGTPSTGPIISSPVPTKTGPVAATPTPKSTASSTLTTHQTPTPPAKTRPHASPGVPINVIATPGVASATVTWTPGSASATQDGYSIAAYICNNCSAIQTLTVSSTTTSVDFSGLAYYNTYFFTVTATDATDGPSAASAPSNSVQVASGAGAPGAATSVVATSVGHGAISLSWAAPVTTGTGGILYYNLTALSASRPFTSTTAFGTSTTMYGFSDGVPASFLVQAIDHASNYGVSSPSNTVTTSPAAGTPPGPVTNLQVFGGDTSDSQRGTRAWIFYGPPASAGSSQVTFYTMTYSSASTVLTNSAAFSSFNVVFLAVTPTTFTVYANNNAGTSTAATSASFTPGAITAPSSPTAFVSANSTAGSATVTWNAPGTDGGSAITGYSITMSPPIATKTTVGTATTSATFTSLPTGSYTFTVTANNGVGSTSSAPTSAVGIGTPPGAPLNVHASTGAASGTIAVTWVAPASSGSGTITSYTASAQLCVNNSCSGLAGSTTVSGSTLAATITIAGGVTAGQQYFVYVVAGNLVGPGSQGFTNYTVPTPLPTAPIGVTAKAGYRSAQVSWFAPNSSGTSPIGTYTVTASPGGASTTVGVSNTLSAILTGLSAGTSYTFAVVATNASGSGPAASSTATAIPADATFNIISGHVYLASTTTPIVGVAVSGACDACAFVPPATTDGSGAFTTGVAASKVDLYVLPAATGSTYGSTATTLVNATGGAVPGVIVYASAATTNSVSGSVTIPGGVAIISGSVNFMLRLQNPRGGYIALQSAPITSGAYMTGQMVPGTYTVEVDYKTASIANDAADFPSTVISGANPTVNFTLPGIVSVSGQVLNGTTPVPHEQVNLISCKATITTGAGCFFGGAADGSGNFTLIVNGGVKYDGVGVQSGAAAFNSESTTVVDTTAGNSVTGVKIAVSPANTTVAGSVSTNGTEVGGFAQVLIPAQAVPGAGIAIAGKTSLAGSGFVHPVNTPNLGSPVTGSGINFANAANQKDAVVASTSGPPPMDGSGCVTGTGTKIVNINATEVEGAFFGTFFGYPVPCLTTPTCPVAAAGETLDWVAAGADTNWSTCANWNPAKIPSNGATLSFGSIYTANPSNNDIANLSGITLYVCACDTSLTITGASISLTGGGVLAVADGGHNAEIDLALTGAGGLRTQLVPVHGIIYLKGANTYSGTTEINNGNSLHALADGAFSPNSAVDISGVGQSGSCLCLDGHTETIRSLQSDDSGKADVYLGSNGNLTIASSPPGGAVFQGTVDGEGAITLADGTKQVISGSGPFTGSITPAGPNTVLELVGDFPSLDVTDTSGGTLITEGDLKDISLDDSAKLFVVGELNISGSLTAANSSIADDAVDISGDNTVDVLALNAGSANITTFVSALNELAPYVVPLQSLAGANPLPHSPVAGHAAPTAQTSLAPGAAYTFLHAGTLTGTFSNMAEGSTFTWNGNSVKVHYTTNAVSFEAPRQLPAGWGLYLPAYSNQALPAGGGAANVPSISGAFDTILGFDQTRGGLTRYSTDPTAASSNDLLTLQAMQGYWVHMTKAGALTNVASGPYNVNLNPGWNLVGYGQPTSKPPTVVAGLTNVSGLGGVDIVEGFDPVNGYQLWFADPNHAALNNLTNLSPGMAYWVHYSGNSPVTWNQ